jgi:hypothetical protein
MGQVVVVQHAAPRIEGFVGREHHRPPFPMAVIDHMEEHVGRIRPVGEIADFVDDQHARMDIRSQGLREAAAPKGCGEFVNQFGGGHKAGVEAILDRAIGDRHGEVRLAAPGFAAEDDAPALGDKVRCERGAQERETDRGLVEEIEIINRLQKRKACPPHEAVQPCLLAMRHFLRDQQRQEIAITPVLLLGPPRQVAPDPSRIGEVQPFD